MSVAPIQAVDPLGAQAPIRMAGPAAAASAISFADLLTQGIDAANTKLALADRLVAEAAVDQSVPLHRVTFAIEEARLSFELLIQVRNRLIDASQQLLNMPL